MILLLFIMAATSFLLLAIFSIMEAHFLVSQTDDLHQAAYYLAETGINYAIAELTRIIEEVHLECLSDFVWNPLSEPLLSLQESAGNHVADELYTKVKRRLSNLGYLSDFPEPLPPESIPQSKIDVRVYMPAAYSYPAKILIVSTGTTGKIRRRIDAHLLINDVSNIYDSKLFDMVIVSGGAEIRSGGMLQTIGSLYSQGTIQADEQSHLDLQGKVYSKHNIIIQNGSSAVFSQDMICRSLSASGTTGTTVSCLRDVYAYNSIEAYSIGNTIDIKGKLYIAPDTLYSSAGVIAQDSGRIILEDDVFINGTLDYPAFGLSLFFMNEVNPEEGSQEETPLLGDIFHSNESIGGNNHPFYFADNAPEYSRSFFGQHYLELSDDARTNLLYEYLTKPPGTEEELAAYEAHTALLDKNSIRMLRKEPDSGYAAGLIFSDGQVIRKSNLQQPESFFHKVLLEMEKQASWCFENQLKSTVSVPSYNVFPEGNSFSVLDPQYPIVYILPEEEDIYLPQGEYSGIIFTNGSIRVNKDENVSFTGLIIAGGKLIVEGNLTVIEDKNLLLRLLDEQGEPLMSFFCIRKEKPLIELQSCREHLYIEVIGG